MWLQRKIMARVHKDPRFFDLDSEWCGWVHLEESVQAFKDQPGLTALVPDIQGVDPDDAFSSVPYEKGFSLLVLLEQIVGTNARGEERRVPHAFPLPGSAHRSAPSSSQGTPTPTRPTKPPTPAGGHPGL